MKSYSIVFVGTGAFGKKSFELICMDKRFDVKSVITRQDKPSGRKQAIVYSPIKESAITNNKIVHQPRHISELQQKLVHICPDFLLVVSYGEIIPKNILEIPSIAAVNIHPSLLPKYRGSTPIQEAILQGDSVTGVTWIVMNTRVDSGAIIIAHRVPISETDTSITLAEKLSLLAARKTPEVLIDFANNRRTIVQDENFATYCKKITKADGLLDFRQETAEQMCRKLCAYQPWPGCYFFLNKKRIIVLEGYEVEQKISPGEVLCEKDAITIGTRVNAFSISMLRPEGKRPMQSAEFLKGLRGEGLTTV